MTVPTRIPLWGDDGVRRTEFDPVFPPLSDIEVFIWSGEHNAYWGPNKSGYYDRSGAGIYGFRHAYSITWHCGPEKRIAYEPIVIKITHAQFSTQCSWIAKHASNWAGEVIINEDDLTKPMTLEAIRRFADGVRKQLDLIERWNQP